MFKVHSVSALREKLKVNSQQNLIIGLVPTMGALHEGHFELLRKSKQASDFTIVTIFVNPKQFNKEEDFINYPSTIESDIASLSLRGCDLVFIPEAKELYPENPIIKFDFGKLEEVLEGKYRPGHFQGVALILTKFFNLIKPQKVYLGLKDLQQFLLIQQLVKDFSFDIDLVGVPTVREKNGLALSSRNLRLSALGKEVAANIFKGLEIAGKEISQKEPPKDILRRLLEFYQKVDGLDIEYVEIVNAKDLESIHSYEDVMDVALCIAAYVENIRLIDNLYLHLHSKK